MRTKQHNATPLPVDERQQASPQQPRQPGRSGPAETSARCGQLPQSGNTIRDADVQHVGGQNAASAIHLEADATAQAGGVNMPHPSQTSPPLLPLPQDCIVGCFVQRRKRFSVELTLHGEPVWVHSNNSGSMLGLTRPGCPVLASHAANPARKLKYTQECVWLRQTALPAEPASETADSINEDQPAPGFWVGVNTSVPNRMLEAAFHAGRLHFASGYTSLVREAKRGQSRLDGLITGPGLPPLWMECKNVTMVEDDAACFPDAASERGQKHLRELMDIVAQGERAAMFYLVQRPDGRCFAPADFIDPEYARLFYEALACGVEVYPYRALVSKYGIDLGGLIPLRPTP